MTKLQAIKKLRELGKPVTTIPKNKYWEIVDNPKNRDLLRLYHPDKDTFWGCLEYEDRFVFSE